MSSTTTTEVVIGVDTHKDVHVAVALDLLGARLASTTISAGAKGYQALETWAAALGTARAFGIEGTGSYGSGLSRFLRERGHAVFEVNRPNRQLRRQKGKSDAVDAEAAARAVLAGQATGQPKSGTGSAEMIRHLKIARDTAVKGRTQAMLTLKALIISALDALREALGRGTTRMVLLRRLAAMRPGPMISTMASAKASLRAIARALAGARCRDQGAQRPSPGVNDRPCSRTAQSARDGDGYRGRDAAGGRRQPRAHPLGGGVR